MAGLKRTLDMEIQRISAAQVREGTRRLRKSATRMKEEIKALRREVTDLKRIVRGLQKQPAKTAVPTAPKALTAEVKNSRPTAESVKRLRRRLGLSQKDFAQLVNVTPLTVYLWERQTGRLNLRSKAKLSLFNARNLSKREAIKELSESSTA